MERAEQAMKKEADSLRALREKLNNYRAGTPDYNDLEAKVRQGLGRSQRPLPVAEEGIRQGRGQDLLQRLPGNPARGQRFRPSQRQSARCSSSAARRDRGKAGRSAPRPEQAGDLVGPQPGHHAGDSRVAQQAFVATGRSAKQPASFRAEVDTSGAFPSACRAKDGRGRREVPRRLFWSRMTSSSRWKALASNARSAPARSVAGFAIGAGATSASSFRPAEAGTGSSSSAATCPAPPRIPARIDHRVDQPRRTSLQCGAARVDMIEHVMAALGGLAIDNCEVWVDEPEMPGCDGSALPFVEALDKAGIVEQAALRALRVVREPIRLGDRDSWIEARPAVNGGPCSTTIWTTAWTRSSAGRPTRPPSRPRSSAASWPLPDVHAQGRGRLASGQGIGHRTRAQDLLVYNSHGPIDNHERFRDECARHKLVDMLGDLALAGCDLVGRFIAHRSGPKLECRAGPFHRQGGRRTCLLETLRLNYARPRSRHDGYVCCR